MKTVITEKAPQAIGPYSQAKIFGNLVYTSGQIPINPTSAQIEVTSIEEQTHQVCKNLCEVLKAAGTNLENVIKTTCFLKNINDFSAFNAVYEQYFTQKPARSCVEVSNLPKNALVEIEVIAEL